MNPKPTCEICREFNVKEPAVYIWFMAYRRLEHMGVKVKPLCEGCRIRVMDMSDETFQDVEIMKVGIDTVHNWEAKNVFIGTG